jgi:hypothetical protein
MQQNSFWIFQLFLWICLWLSVSVRVRCQPFVSTIDHLLCLYADRLKE